MQTVVTDLHVSEPLVLVPHMYDWLCDGKHFCMEIVSPTRLLNAGLLLDYAVVC